MSSILNSGLKIFDIIEILCESPESRENLRKKLLKKNISIETETVSKYIRTLRALGFEINSTKGNPYQIVKTPFKISLNEKEKSGLIVLLSFLKLFEGCKSKEYKCFKDKVTELVKNKILQNEIAKIADFMPDNDNKDIILKLNKYIYSPSKVRIFYLNTKSVVIPKKLKFADNGVFLVAYHIKEQKFKTINTKFIKNVKYLSKLSENVMIKECGTVFKLTGRLIRNYVLKEGEVAHYKDFEVRVTNFYEDKDELLNRLLKYGKNCEVVYPVEDRELMKKKIEKMIKHYQSM